MHVQLMSCNPSHMTTVVNSQWKIDGLFVQFLLKYYMPATEKSMCGIKWYDERAGRHDTNIILTSIFLQVIKKSSCT